GTNYAKGIGLIGKDFCVIGYPNVCRSFYQRGLGLAVGNYHNKCAGIAYRIFYGRGIGLAIGDYDNGYSVCTVPVGLNATPPSSSDPVSRLLEGLEKMIKGGGKPEELSKVVEGPKLPEMSDSSSVNFGDWLYCLEHTMGDTSASSAEWWKLVVKDAQEYYDKYQAADQYGRLSMKPTPSAGLEDSKWTRVDRRGASVLLGAVPEYVKKELIASRAKSTLDVLARLMVLYRPGSAMEKGQLLKRIETPEPCTTTQDAVEGLRQWLRYYQRAKDLKLSIPDPSILVKALDGMLKKPVADHPDVGFRMNLLRYHLKVDFLPSEDNVLAIHRAFLAEFEQMGYKKKGTERTSQRLNGGTGAMSVEQRAWRRQPQGGNEDAEPVSTVPTEVVATTAPTSETPVQGVPVEQLLEVSELQETPALKELMKTEGDFTSICRMGLLDSGATHPLRPRTEKDVVSEMGKVSVTLAGENKVEMQQSRAGTILGSESTQAIVPLGTVVKQLGYDYDYEFGWNRRGCFLRHPDKVLEEARLAETLATLKAAVAAAKGHTQWTWTDAIREYVTTGEREAGVRAVLAAPFMHHVPMEDQLKIMAEIGVKNDPLRDIQGILEIDLQKGWNLNDDKIYGVLLWAALNKKIKHAVGGPPGGTFSPYRYREGAEGPKPVRSNHEPRGLREGLGVDESAKVKNENRMLLRMVGFCLEFPEDPREYLPDGSQKSQCVSMWRMEFIKEFIHAATHFEKAQFEQGALGHMLRRPTGCLTNLRLGIHGLRDSRAWVSAECADPDQSVWPHGFRLTLADAVHEWNAAGGGVALKKAMTKTELEEWKAHLDRGHWPYRRDCSVCLAASGTGRPARRVVHRDAYVLSLDIVGPFADVGRDEVRGCRYRFALAATYLYPKIREVPEDAPIPDEEEAEKFLAEEEDQPEDGEQGPEDPGADEQEEEWKKKVEDLRRPMEMQALRFVWEDQVGKTIWWRRLLGLSSSFLGLSLVVRECHFAPCEKQFWALQKQMIVSLLFFGYLAAYGAGHA
ncbi:unnamed protein product, partial [Symbiodinium sp. CCMP2592]